MDERFEGRHLDREIIVLCVRWYLRFKLSFRDLVEMMAERGLSMAHTTIMRWVHHDAPAFERRWNRFARPTGSSWRADEVVTEWATGRRKEEGMAPGNRRPRKSPSARGIARMMTTERDRPSKTVARMAAVIESAVPDLVSARDLMD